MRDEESKSVAKELASGLTSAVAAGFQTSATTGDLALAWFAALGAGLPSFMSLAIGATFKTKLERAREWWSQVVEATAADSGVAAEIEARANEPEVQKVIDEAFGRVMEVQSPDVIRPLAMLTREYARQGKPADLFFRGMGRLLSDLTTDDVRALRAAFEEFDLTLASDIIEVRMVHRDGTGFRLTQMIRSARDKRYLPHKTIDIPGDIAERLIRLLKANYLNREFIVDIAQQGLGPEALLLDRETAKRIQALLA